MQFAKGVKLLYFGSLVLRILNYCFPLSYFDFAQHRLQVGKDYMRAYISALAAPSVEWYDIIFLSSLRIERTYLGDWK